MIRSIAIMIAFCYMTSNCLASGEWIPYNPNQSIININQPVMVQTQAPTYIQQPILYYELVPYYINREVINEKYGIFCFHRTITYQPNIIWVYRPVYKSFCGTFQ